MAPEALTPPERGGPQVIPRPPTAQPGGDPPWAPLIGTRPEVTTVTARAAFSRYPVERSLGLVVPELERSAVAVLLSGGPDGEELEVLLTRRAWGLRTHRGEVSFAGGAEDPTDEFPVGTALREAWEEIAFAHDEVHVAGALDPLTTHTSDRVVVPVVMVVPERPTVVASPAEVDALLHVPIHELLHPDCYHQERWSWDGDVERPPRTDHPMHFFDLPGDTIWGATAAMLHQLLVILLLDGATVEGGAANGR